VALGAPIRGATFPVIEGGVHRLRRIRFLPPSTRHWTDSRMQNASGPSSRVCRLSSTPGRLPLNSARRGAELQARRVEEGRISMTRQAGAKAAKSGIEYASGEGRGTGVDWVEDLTGEATRQLSAGASVTTSETGLPLAALCFSVHIADGPQFDQTPIARRNRRADALRFLRRDE
jgi:hypothetical protein